MHYSYLIYSKHKNKYYAGYSHDLKQRMTDHRLKEVVTTKDYPDGELVWYAAFKTKEKALAFERYLKSSSGFAFRNKRLV